MMIKRRQPGDRRWGLPVEFPLLDSSGFNVPVDRRKITDRRRAIATLEEVQRLLSQKPGKARRL